MAYNSEDPAETLKSISFKVSCEKLRDLYQVCQHVPKELFDRDTNIN